MNTCDTCKHWGNLMSVSATGCVGVSKRYTAYTKGTCANPKLDGLSVDGAEPCDTEGYCAWLDTGAKFGCIHHEPA